MCVVGILQFVSNGWLPCTFTFYVPVDASRRNLSNMLSASTSAFYVAVLYFLLRVKNLERRARVFILFTAFLMHQQIGCAFEAAIGEYSHRPSCFSYVRPSAVRVILPALDVDLHHHL